MTPRADKRARVQDEPAVSAAPAAAQLLLRPLRAATSSTWTWSSRV